MVSCTIFLGSPGSRAHLTSCMLDVSTNNIVNSDLLRMASPAGTQNEIVAPVAGEDATHEPQNITGLKGLTLGTPQQEVHRQHHVRNERQAQPFLAC